jgi:hypothetical protein
MERKKQIELTVDLLGKIHNTRNPPKNKRRHTSVVNDQPKGEDGLNYTGYANAFGLLLSDARIALPITVGIYSSWGTGKSFLLGKIKEYIETNINSKIKRKRSELKRKCICNARAIKHNIGYEYIIIDFNAWSYSFSDVLWAGLVKEIHTKVEDRYGFLALRFFRFFIYPFRSNSKQKMACIILYGILRFVSLVIFTILLSAVLTEDAFVNIFGEVAIYSVFGLTIATIIPTIIQLIITLCQDKGTEIMKGAKNIADQVGFMGDVRDELELICDFVKLKRAKFAVFIDDLDRCPPSKIVDMVDATMLLLSNLDYPFLTFITIDPRIIVKSIESTYQDVFHCCGITGFEYLDKLIQIPFSIPIASPQVKDGIIQILIREKEEVLNKVFELCIYFVKNNICFKDIEFKIYPKKHIYEIEEYKLTYNDKIEYIKLIYSYIIEEYGQFFDVKYIYNITNTADILKLLLNILRHLKSVNETFDNNINNINISSELSKYLSSQSNILNESKIGELKNIIIDKAEDTAGKSILTPEMCNIFNRIKELNVDEPPRDVDFRDFGLFIQNRKNRETVLILENELNDIIIEFYGYFRTFINTKNIRFSPINEELHTLYVCFEKIIRTVENTRGTLYAHSQSMLSIKEVEYFHEIAQYFDGNCRRNKRIINVYVIIKNILGDRIIGWYKSCPVTIYTLKILIKLVILFEQWPYRMCAIFQIIENYKGLLLKLPGENDGETQGDGENEGDGENDGDGENQDDEIDTLDQWLEVHRFSTLQMVYANIPTGIMNSEKVCNMMCNDYNHYLFETFLNVEPIITIEYFYICIGYVFNINYSIKHIISNMLNKIEYSKNKSDSQYVN